MGMLIALPVMAQEEATAASPESAEVAPADASAPADVSAADAAGAEAAPADAAAAEAAPADAAAADAGAEAAPADVAAEAAPADAAAADLSAEAAPVEEAPAEAAAEEAPAEDSASESADSGEPFHFYIGVDKAEVTLALSDDALVTAFGGDELESSMYRIRAGTRLLDAVGIELHYGVADDKDDGAEKFEVGEYYGIFVVPTGSLFELVEISVPIGYSSMKAERGAASETFDGVSYGLNVEVPITLNSDWIPDIRLGGGGLVYRADRDSRVYGYHFGVRLDFKI
ncbi:hypothetical protein D0B54_17250 [Solimonas sp. K1W22B-7]|nr:hypothetical protein D0B54_17250 [Solimonas sp. K1W22B-7]